MEKLTVETIRALVKQLKSTDILPRKNIFGKIITFELRDGIVYYDFGAMHPSVFLDTFGIMKFRKLKRDVTKRQIDAYIKTWKKNRKK